MKDALGTIHAVNELSARRGTFRADAYLFVLEALEQAMADMETPTHISGEHLLDTIRDIGQERYGVMAADVFRSWGVRSTLDFGRIVFHLVDEGLLRKRESDTLGDFIDKFDFEEAFSLASRETLKARRGQA